LFFAETLSIRGVRDSTSWAVLRLPTETELRILALIQQGETSSLGISKRLKIPTSTVWRKVRRLQEAGFIEAEGREVRLTNKGRIFVKFFQNSRI